MSDAGEVDVDYVDYVYDIDDACDVDEGEVDDSNYDDDHHDDACAGKDEGDVVM